MGIITAKHIIDRVSFTLKDKDNVRWPREELLAYVNEGMRTIVRLDPACCTVRTVMRLAEGTHQTLPEGAICLLSVYRNIQEDGKSGAAVRAGTRNLFDSMFTDWQGEGSTTEVENYFFDARDETGFDVYPPNNGFGRLEISYSALPPYITENDPISIGDKYVSCLTSYVLYKAATLDSDFNGTGALAQFYYQTFVSELNGFAEAEVKAGPAANYGKGPVKANGDTA